MKHSGYIHMFMNTEQERLFKRQSKKKAVERNRNYIREYLSMSMCTDCGIGDWRVLEFDHLPEYSKHKNVCDMMHCSIKKLQEEIDKCEVVCSNCHSLRSFKRGNSWRML